MAYLMLVDDNADMRRLLMLGLRSLGHETVTFSGGVDALAHIEHPANPLPDLIILDYMMPEMDGLECLSKLRGGHRGSNIPVALFTANDDPELRKRARDTGANDFWLKSAIDLFAIDERVRQLHRVIRMNAPLIPLSSVA